MSRVVIPITSSHEAKEGAKSERTPVDDMLVGGGINCIVAFDAVGQGCHLYCHWKLRQKQHLRRGIVFNLNVDSS